MAETTPEIDVTRKFVRLTEIRPDGFVEFDFAIGEPELFVEMLMSEASFREFCQVNQVEMLEGPRPACGAEAEWDWRLQQATSQHFRNPESEN